MKTYFSNSCKVPIQRKTPKVLSRILVLKYQLQAHVYSFFERPKEMKILMK